MGNPRHISEVLGNFRNLLADTEEAPCSQCGNSCLAFHGENNPLCDDCMREKWRESELKEFMQHWKKICPPAFLNTDKKHPDFPVEAWERVKDWRFGRSLLLFGDTRMGKTRVAMLLIRRAFAKGKSIGMVWPEELKEYARSNQKLGHIRQLGERDVLLLDDALLTGAQDERIADFLKDLIDYMIRMKNIFIITSQVGQAEYLEQADKFGNMTRADKARVTALLKRIEQECQVIPFINKEEDF